MAVPEDAPGIGKLLAASYPELMAERYSDAALAAALPVMTRANPVLLKSGTYHVAQTGDEHLVGCGGWTPERPDTGVVEPRLAHIRHFATHPDWIRRGIGRAIFNECLREAANNAVECLECYSSLNAEPFYRALGFTRVREIEMPIGPDTTFTGVLMERAV